MLSWIDLPSLSFDLFGYSRPKIVFHNYYWIISMANTIFLCLKFFTQNEYFPPHLNWDSISKALHSWHIFEISAIGVIAMVLSWGDCIQVTKRFDVCKWQISGCEKMKVKFYLFISGVWSFIGRIDYYIG